MIKNADMEENFVSTMCKIIEELISGEKKEIALKMLRDGKLAKEEIANYFGLTLDEVEVLEKEITQTV